MGKYKTRLMALTLVGLMAASAAFAGYWKYVWNPSIGDYGPGTWVNSDVWDGDIYFSETGQVNQNNLVAHEKNHA